VHTPLLTPRRATVWSITWNLSNGLSSTGGTPKLPIQIVTLHSTFGKSLCTYKRRWKWCPRASMQAWTRLILFADTFYRSACEMFLHVRSYCSF
jgi:hypothetical protein